MPRATTNICACCSVRSTRSTGTRGARLRRKKAQTRATKANERGAFEFPDIPCCEGIFEKVPRKRRLRSRSNGTTCGYTCNDGGPSRRRRRQLNSIEEDPRFNRFPQATVFGYFKRHRAGGTLFHCDLFRRVDFLRVVRQMP